MAADAVTMALSMALGATAAATALRLIDKRYKAISMAASTAGVIVISVI